MPSRYTETMSGSNDTRLRCGDPRIGVRIDQCRLTCVTDGVIAAEPLVRQEGLELHGSEGGLIDVGAWKRTSAAAQSRTRRGPAPLVSAIIRSPWRTTEVRGPADVDAVVGVSGMAHDFVVFFVEGVHGRQATRRGACSSLAWAGRLVCCHAPRRRDVLFRPPGRCTRTVSRDRGVGWYLRCVPGCVEKRRSSGSRLPD